MTLDIAVVGVGEIARAQHLPTIARDPRFRLAALVSRTAPPGETPTFPTIDALLASDVAVDAVSLCAPPEPRFAQATAALKAGKHLLLEKPPGATTGEVDILKEAARAAGVTLVASWHSRHAAAVAEAGRLLAGRRIVSGRIVWREDVRKWHPGQTWIWEPAGMGVFDPGVNALSIATEIWPTALRVVAADLSVPTNAATPIAAELQLEDGDGAAISASFDWREAGRDRWTIEVETDGGRIELLDGGARLAVDGVPAPVPPVEEYASVYARFADCVAAQRSDVDVAPFRLVADANLLGRRHATEPFDG